MTEPKPRLLSVSQAASRLGIHPDTLRAWTDKGLVPHHRLLSGYRRYDPEEIKQLSLKMQIPAEDKEGEEVS